MLIIDVWKAIPLTFRTLDYVAAGTPPYCLNDQPLPAATIGLPTMAAGTYPIGSICTLTFPVLTGQERSWITAQCATSVTLTINDTIDTVGYCRITGQGVLQGNVLTVTLTQATKLNFVGGTYGYW